MAGIDNNTVLYLRGDSFNDLSPSPKSITNNNGEIVEDSTFVKCFNKTPAPSNMYTSDLGDISNEFTIEMFVNFSSFTSARCITKVGTNANYNGILFYTTSSGITLYSSNTSSWNILNAQPFSPNMETNKWYHLALCFKNGTYTTFVNGKKTYTYSASKPNFSTCVATVGFYGDGTATQDIPCKISHYRISNVARYIEDFTPPTQPYNSIEINTISQTATNINFSVAKLGQEVINKVEVYINNILSQTYIDNYDNIDYVIDKSMCNFGNNNITIKVIYDDNYTEEKVLTHIVDLPSLPPISTETSLLDTLNNIKEVSKLAELEKDTLKTILDTKGVDVTDINKMSILISKVNELRDKKPLIYGIDIDETNSNPSTCVTYTDDAVGFTPLFCGNGTLDYGSWKDTFVIQGNKPCVLKNGEVQYYLNPDDYSLKENGEASDITSGNDGDVMAEFKKCYYKLWKEGNIVKFRVSPTKVDDTWCCNAFLGEDGNATEKDYMYMSVYEAYSDGSKMRSLSGKTPWVNHTIGTARTQATANGSGYQQLTLSKHTFITMLSVLVTKSLNSQTVLGQGRTSSGNTSAINSGTMNTKGQFWGDQTGTNGVKLFHIENFYGNIRTFVDGLIVLSGTSKYKISSPYNDDGSNYVNGYSVPSTNGYIDKINCDNNNGFIPSSVSASSSTYYSDYIWRGSSNYITFVGGYWADSLYAGVFCMAVYYASTSTSSGLAGRLSYS